MYKKPRRTSATSKGDQTADLILGTALDLFRTRGYDQTSMREIASAVQLAVGAAYYYYPSKEHLVLAYFDEVQRKYAAILPERLAGVRGVAQRFEVAVATKVELVREDRALLRALFRYAADPEHPLSIMSKETAHDRAAAYQSFSLVLANTRLPDDLAERAPRLLWLIHLGVLFLLLHDKTPDARRVRALVPAIASVTGTILRVAAAPGMGVLRKRTSVLSNEIDRLLDECA